ncbi:MAG TPA: putative LPS assembly protein LptD, partial [Gammaproteobacteria bacterium]|nr:putative LPS assembly protein LptD [Gammaproteobacteria bacterium]
MSNNSKFQGCIFFLLISVGLSLIGFNYPARAASRPGVPTYTSVKHSQEQLAKLLGWVESPINRCGGYYLESPLASDEGLIEAEKLKITSDQYTFAQKGISTLEGKVTINYRSRELIANKAYLYRDAETGKLTAVDMDEALHLREPNTLILANRGRFDIKTKANFLSGIIYRTAIYGGMINAANYPRAMRETSALELSKPHKIMHLSAWGEAKQYYQDEPHIYNFDDVSYTTCPPTHSVWQVKASHIQLNKETGRGTAQHARLLFKSIPIFYTPYMNFPIDSRRKTGILWPTVGSLNRNNSYSGYYFGIPFYWNIAPNYDTTITPTYYSERGLQIADLFRYLTPA